MSSTIPINISGRIATADTTAPIGESKSGDNQGGQQLTKDPKTSRTYTLSRLPRRGKEGRITEVSAEEAEFAIFRHPQPRYRIIGRARQGCYRQSMARER